MTSFYLLIQHELLYKTYLLLVPHICVSKLGQHWVRQWLVASSVPSHDLNQCWLIFSLTPWNKFQWNSNRNSIIFINKNVFENCRLSNWRPFCPWGDELTYLELVAYIYAIFDSGTLARISGACSFLSCLKWIQEIHGLTYLPNNQIAVKFGKNQNGTIDIGHSRNSQRAHNWIQWVAWN